MIATATRRRRKRRSKDVSLIRPFITIDTETTGPNLWKGMGDVGGNIPCAPFFISACVVDDPEKGGKLYHWELDVDPWDRSIVWNEKLDRARDELLALCSLEDHLAPWEDSDSISRDLVFHNASFDIRALENLDIFLPKKFGWESIHDTVLASHVLDSNGSHRHKLKHLCLLHFDYEDDDEADLRNAVVRARRIGDKLGWRIGPKGKSKGKNKDSGVGWDYWLPKAIAVHHPELLPNAPRWVKGNPPSEHPWYNYLERYGVDDAERTAMLHILFQRMIDEQDGEVQYRKSYERERRLMESVYVMEGEGFPVIKDSLDEKFSELTETRDKAERHCRRVARNQDLNLQSDQQVKRLVFDDWKVEPVGFTGSGAPSLDQESRAVLLDNDLSPKAEAFLESYDIYSKSGTAHKYLKGYLEAGITEILHPDRRVQLSTSNFEDVKILWLMSSFNQTGTGTTRFTSSSPNLQNVSKRKVEFQLRSVFGPLPGRVWFPIDYSNLELRIFAILTQDQDLIDCYARGLSVHLLIFRELFPHLSHLSDEEVKKREEYGWTKNGNFSLIYGASKTRADATYHVDGAYDRIRSRFPLIDDFMRSTIALARTQGFVTTMDGYPLIVPRREPYKGVDYRIQGTAGSIVKDAMISTYSYLQEINQEYPQLDGKLILNVHDELVFDFNKRNPTTGRRISNRLLHTVVAEICRLMEKAGSDIGSGLITPVEASRVDTRWNEAKELSL